MKKILLIAVLFITGVSFGQTPKGKRFHDEPFMDFTLNNRTIKELITVLGEPIEMDYSISDCGGFSWEMGDSCEYFELRYEGLNFEGFGNLKWREANVDSVFYSNHISRIEVSNIGYQLKYDVKVNITSPDDIIKLFGSPMNDPNSSLMYPLNSYMYKTNPISNTIFYFTDNKLSKIAWETGTYH